MTPSRVFRDIHRTRETYGVDWGWRFPVKPGEGKQEKKSNPVPPAPHGASECGLSLETKQPGVPRANTLG